jgi:hypothetical protein
VVRPEEMLLVSYTHYDYPYHLEVENHLNKIYLNIDFIKKKPNHIRSQYKYQNYVDHIELVVVLLVVAMMNSLMNRCATKRIKLETLEDLSFSKFIL